MKAIILAGGNQTRFGKTINEQSKVLYPLGAGKTLLSNILDQLDRSFVEEIIVHTSDKTVIAEYVQNIKTKYHKPITIDDRFLPGLGNYFFHSLEYIPATYIFGDVFFPENSLLKYFENLQQNMTGMVGMIGVNTNRVGDYRVKVVDGFVQDIREDVDEGYFTCGLFTAIDSQIFRGLEQTNKITDIFAQLPHKNHKLGCVLLEDKLVDLDTIDKVKDIMVV